jgi:hypothetical protein
MSSGARRISVGFQGGQVLALRIDERQLESLYAVLGQDGWYVIEGEDGPVRVDLGKVVYVSADSEELHVGFG